MTKSQFLTRYSLEIYRTFLQEEIKSLLTDLRPPLGLLFITRIEEHDKMFYHVKHVLR